MGLKLSPSTLEVAFAEKPELQPYTERLKRLGNKMGELELTEVAEVVKDLVEAEKSRRILKWFSVVMAGLLLLTIAATTGLTYAVVALSKDIKADNGVMIEKVSGDPMLVGSPSIALIYDPNDAAVLAQVFNNSAVADIVGQGRRLLAAEEYCSNPAIEALALTSIDYVRSKCAYISKAGTDSKFTLKVQKATKSDCEVADTRQNYKCGSYQDHVIVTDEECNLLTQQLKCSSPGQSYTIGMIWADSLIANGQPTSYFINCRGTCSDKNVVTFGQCGVARSRCPAGSTGAGSGRRLQGSDESTAAMPTFSIFGAEMNCQSGACFATL